jgi:hypothetical protein
MSNACICAGGSEHSAALDHAIYRDRHKYSRFMACFLKKHAEYLNIREARETNVLVVRANRYLQEGFCLLQAPHLPARVLFILLKLIACHVQCVLCQACLLCHFETLLSHRELADKYNYSRGTVTQHHLFHKVSRIHKNR